MEIRDYVKVGLGSFVGLLGVMTVAGSFTILVSVF